MTNHIQNIATSVGGIALLVFLALAFSFFLPLLDNPDPLIPLRVHLMEELGNTTTMDATIHEYQRAFFLDRSFGEQFTIYCKNVLQGNFGASVRNYPQPTIRIIIGPFLRLIPILFLLPIAWALALFFSVKVALSFPTISRRAGWAFLPLCGVLLCIGQAAYLSIPAITFFIVSPMIIRKTLELRDQNYLRFAIGLGIPEINLKKFLQANVLRAFIPHLPILYIWFLGFASILDGIWHKPSLSSLLLSAKWNADFSLVRSTSFILFLGLTIPAFLLFVWKPSNQTQHGDLFPTQWSWIDMLLLLVASFLLLRASEPLPIILIAVFVSGIKYLAADKLPVPSSFWHIPLVPAWILVGKLALFPALVLSLLTVFIGGTRERSLAMALRHGLFVLVLISLMQQFNLSSLPLL